MKTVRQLKFVLKNSVYMQQHTWKDIVPVSKSELINVLMDSISKSYVSIAVTLSVFEHSI